MTVQVELQFFQQVGRDADAESYQIRVARAPGSGWGGPLYAGALDGAQADAVRQLYRRYVQRQQSASRLPVGPSDLEPLRAAGNQLFQSFPQTVRARLHEALALAREKGQSLDLVLTFEPSAQALLSLPWELLHSPEGRFFFALQGNLTRRLLLPAAPSLRTVRSRATLGLWAEPEGLPALDPRRRSGPAPDQGGDTSGIFWLHGPRSLDQLEGALEDGAFSAVHIVAHGRGGDVWQDFSLALEGEQGATHWLSSDQLATFFSRFPPIRSMYLDVCASGQNGGDGSAPGGLAVALLQAGVSDVVVMQEEMSQQASGLMAHHFYAALNQGRPLSEALGAGRRAVRVQQDDPIHWSVPAHYSQQRLPRADVRLPLVDSFLDRLAPMHAQRFLILVALLLLIGHLSYVGATVSVYDVRAVSWFLIQGALLPLLVALPDRYLLRRRPQEKPDEGSRLQGAHANIFSVGVWAAVGWFVVMLLLLGMAWAGLWSRLDLTTRQLFWALCLSGVALAALTGARQSRRQSRLFRRGGAATLTWLDWLVVPILLLLPAGFYRLLMFMNGLPFLLGTGGLAVVLLLLLLLAMFLARDAS